MSLAALAKGFTLGIAIFLTYVISGFLLGIVFGIIPILSFFGDFAWLVSLILQILSMGLVGAVVFKFIH